MLVAALQAEGNLRAAGGGCVLRRMRRHGVCSILYSEPRELRDQGVGGCRGEGWSSGTDGVEEQGMPIFQLLTSHLQTFYELYQVHTQPFPPCSAASPTPHATQRLFLRAPRSPWLTMRLPHSE